MGIEDFFKRPDFIPLLLQPGNADEMVEWVAKNVTDTSARIDVLAAVSDHVEKSDGIAAGTKREWRAAMEGFVHPHNDVQDLCAVDQISDEETAWATVDAHSLFQSFATRGAIDLFLFSIFAPK